MIVSCNLAAGHLPGHCLKRKNITLKNHSANTVYSIHPIMNSFWIWEKYICDIRILIIKCSRNHIFFANLWRWKSQLCIFLILLVAPPPELELKILILFLSCIYFIPAKLRITKEFYLPSKMKKKQVRKYKDYQKNSICRAENLDRYKNTQ